MYETYFGLEGPPFQLNPDPAFYFDSRGHANALAYLRFGVHQAEGFIVVTGDIGAGKTTLVRTLLGDVDSEKVVAAQIVSTQLEAGDLLRSIAAAFGITVSTASKAQLISTIEAYLVALAVNKRRALLIVDEAQNLSPAAVEELRMLSNFMLGSRALLQSFLVGQPDLRPMLASRSMEQFRQRVIASCHLGPLEADETQGYVEHRLRRVGWKDAPHFDLECFEHIYRWTGGVPRRINLLCNRLLLSAFLATRTEISASDVDRMAREITGEVGEPGIDQKARPLAEMVPKEARKRAGAATELAWPVTRRGLPVGERLHNALFILVDTPLGMAKARTLACHWVDQPDAPSLVAVSPCVPTASALDADVTDRLAVQLPEIHLNVPGEIFASTAAVLAPRFGALIEEFAPRAMLTCGTSDGALVCALVAQKHGVPLVSMDAGQRDTDGGTRAQNAALIDRLADLLYTSDPMASLALHREGIRSDRVHGAGRLLRSFINLLLSRETTSVPQILGRTSNFSISPPGGRPYALVTLPITRRDTARARHEVVAMVCSLRRAAPVVWLVSEETLSCIEDDLRHLHRASVAIACEASYVDSMRLLKEAACLICGGDERWLEEARALGTPSAQLGQLADAGTGSGCKLIGSPEQLLQWAADLLSAQESFVPTDDVAEHDAAEALAAHLSDWLAQQGQRPGRQVSIVNVAG